MLISTVLYNPNSTVGLTQRVETVHGVAVAGLVVLLLVVSVRVIHFVLVLILRVSLGNNKQIELELKFSMRAIAVDFLTVAEQIGNRVDCS